MNTVKDIDDITNSTTSRARLILEARAKSEDDALVIESAIAASILGAIEVSKDALARSNKRPPLFETGFRATEEMAGFLEAELTKFASEVKDKKRQAGRYDPLLASEAMFREVWQLRQAADEIDVPYGDFVRLAVNAWRKAGHKRIPRPSQLRAPMILVDVIREWVGSTPPKLVEPTVAAVE